jgi:hypothetical protein
MLHFAFPNNSSYLEPLALPDQEPTGRMIGPFHDQDEVTHLFALVSADHVPKMAVTLPQRGHEPLHGHRHQ